MTFADAVKHVLTNYATFTGRARRSEYWWFYLFTVLLYIVAGIIDAIIRNEILTYVVIVALIVPTLAVGARRLHDTGRSGWWQLIGIIPIVGAILLIVWCATDGQPENKYGPNPKGQLAAPGYPPPPPGYAQG